VITNHENNSEDMVDRCLVSVQSFKGLVHAKMKNYVINDSPSCRFKPVRPLFIFRTV